MRVLVAGATGAIGVPLVQKLVERGHEVVGLTRTQAGADRFGELWSAAVVADALNADALMTAAHGLRVDAVVHELTAIRGLPARYRDLDATNRLRTEGTANLLTLARAAGATSMVTQSFLGGYGYGNHRADGRPSTYQLTEEEGFGPPGRTPGLERIIAALREAERLTLTTPGVAGVVLRYGVFYGHGATLQTMLSLLQKRQLPVPRDGGGVLSFIYLPDAAAATVAALERGRPGQAYNICDDEPTRWAAFIDSATAAFGLRRALRVPCWLFKVTPYAHRFLTSTIPMSNDKAKRELAWTPQAATVREGFALAHESRHHSRDDASPETG
jgi:nucleoside-diphosphate-sugar epimerase